MRLLGYRKRAALLIVVGTITTGAAIAGDVFRWTDADGRVHYGPHPPQGARNTQSILLPESAAPDRAADPSGAQRRERQRRMLDAYAHERERKKAAAAEAEQRRQQRAERCRAIQTQWRRLAFGGRVYFRRDDGSRDYLSDEQRAAEQAQLRPAYIEACGEEPR